jgi:hypothetical protein
VLGLGGWFLGALIVLTTMPGVRIDNKLLIILSVGVPIGLGAYWAWVHRDWSARSKRVGLAAAAAGGLAGAWLGFHATDGLLAVLTAIVGALVGANLTLILLDISRARFTRMGPPQLRRRRMRLAGTSSRCHRPASGDPGMAMHRTPEPDRAIRTPFRVGRTHKASVAA